MDGVAKKIIIELISILSATGSRNLPKSVTWLFFLAKYPSKKSVNDAIKNTKKIIRNTKLIPVLPNVGSWRFGKKDKTNKLMSISAMIMILENVILVGKFIF